MRFGRCAAPKGPTQPGARDAPRRRATLCFHQLIWLFVLAAFLAASDAAFAQKGAITPKIAPKAAPKAIIIKPTAPTDAPQPAPVAPVTPTAAPDLAPAASPSAQTAPPDLTPAVPPSTPAVIRIVPTTAKGAASTPIAAPTVTSNAAASGPQNVKKVSGAVERYRQVDYWDEVHRKEREKKLQELKELQQKRLAVQQAAPGIIKDGEQLRPILIDEELVSAPPPPPSILDTKRDYFLLGLTAILMCALTAYTLFRHRREKEIRILTGKYLSDGTEAAWIQMPALFAGPAAENRHAGLDLTKDDKKEDEDAPQVVAAPAGPTAKFLEDAPNDLAEIRKLLPELSKNTDEADRKKNLFALYTHIDVLRTKAIGWDLRPVWQLTSALALLLKRLVEKPKEATTTTIRTVATGVDLLAELCVPGVRPDLVINPPIAVLAVDDDPLCLRAVMFALQKAEMTPDTAETGEKAVELAKEKAYDVVFMDIKMPGIDGLRACEQIHELKKNENTPVVFVTALSDFRTRAESTLAGGSDLLIKPFLMFEITVKVLIFTMRKRLGLAASLKREVASLTGASQIEGKAIPMLSATQPVATAPASNGLAVNGTEKVEALANDSKSADIPINGAATTEHINGSHDREANGANGANTVYAGAELPSLHMAAAEPLQRETVRASQPARATEEDHKATKRWKKQQKALAKAN